MTALRDPETGRFTSTPVVALDPIREIVCSNCGEPLGEYSRTERTKVGRCCFNLPDPWDLPGAIYDDEADEEEVECDCFDCRYANGVLDRHEFAYLDEWADYLREIHGDSPSARDVEYFEQLSS